jgi:hypothetical protein
MCFFPGDPLPITCSKCPEKFKDNLDMKRHLANIHGRPESEKPRKRAPRGQAKYKGRLTLTEFREKYPVTCSQAGCKKRFVSALVMEAHHRKKHLGM